MIRFLKLYEKFGIFIFIFPGAVFLAFASPNFLKLDTLLNILAQGTLRGAGRLRHDAWPSPAEDSTSRWNPSWRLSSVFLAILIPVIGIPLAILGSLVLVGSRWAC